jgi:hypothetical protein
MRRSRDELSELEKAGMEGALCRCRALAKQIDDALCETLLQDVSLLAELQASLDHAVSLLKKRDGR